VTVAGTMADRPQRRIPIPRSFNKTLVIDPAKNGGVNAS
jgi:hypothetical protein